MVSWSSRDSGEVDEESRCQNPKVSLEEAFFFFFLCYYFFVAVGMRNAMVELVMCVYETPYVFIYRVKQVEILVPSSQFRK